MIERTSIKHDRLIKRLTEPLLQSFGISYFCYQFVSTEGDWFTLGNNPEWLLYSADNEFFQTDPSLVHPSCYDRPYVCFPKYYSDERFQKTLVDHAIELFDIDHALAIIHPTKHGCEYYFFAAPRAHAKVENIYLNQLDKLGHDYKNYVKKQLQPILHNCQNNTVNLNRVNPQRFNAKDSLFQEDIINAQSKFLSSINYLSPLTKREQQCLVLYQQGLTAKQTAQQLGVSHRTVERHFDNIKDKFEVVHKRDLLNKLLYT